MSTFRKPCTKHLLAMLAENPNLVKQYEVNIKKDSKELGESHLTHNTQTNQPQLCNWKCLGKWTRLLNLILSLLFYIALEFQVINIPFQTGLDSYLHQYFMLYF